MSEEIRENEGLRRAGRERLTLSKYAWAAMLERELTRGGLSDRLGKLQVATFGSETHRPQFTVASIRSGCIDFVELA